jgi:THO complex subunit 5
MAPRKAIRTSNDMSVDSDLLNFNPDDYIKTAHNSRLYEENQNLKKRVKELVEYQIAHPKLAKPTTREDIDNEKKVTLEIEIKKKYIRAQLAVIKTLYRSSVMKVREEKEQTAKSRSHNDGLILDLNNLKYEEQSLRSEISAAENHEYVTNSAAIFFANTHIATNIRNCHSFPLKFSSRSSLSSKEHLSTTS